MPLHIFSCKYDAYSYSNIHLTIHTLLYQHWHINEFFNHFVFNYERHQYIMLTTSSTLGNLIFYSDKLFQTLLFQPGLPNYFCKMRFDYKNTNTWFDYKNIWWALVRSNNLTNYLQKFELLEKYATILHVMLPKHNSEFPIHSTKSSIIWNPGDCYRPPYYCYKKLLNFLIRFSIYNFIFVW